MKNIKKRLSKLRRLLKQEAGEAALLIGSPVAAKRNHDVSYPFRQDSNLFYCSDSRRSGLNLLISSRDEKPLIIARKLSKLELEWDDELEKLSSIASRMGANVVETTSPKKEILERLKGIEVLYYGQAAGSAAWSCAQQLMQQSIVSSREFPVQFKHSDLLFNQLRVIKDADEINRVKCAIEDTWKVLKVFVPAIRAGESEGYLRDLLLSETQALGREPSFNPIVATGVSAAKPHYSAFKRKLKSSELLLVDFGLECDQYAADVTRVFPVAGKFSEVHRDVYEIVREAKDFATRKLKPGAKFKACQDACDQVLIEGLKELGVLKGKVSTIKAKGLHKPYTIHSVSHSLGLDVHDISKDRFSILSSLKKGMILTVEPGLYFSKKTKHIPPCGVRLEDDVLVTSSGNRNLSEAIPITCEQIEEWMQI